MFKKGDEVENNYTNKRRKIVAVETVNKDLVTQVTVYVLDDREGIVGERWAEDQLIAHWRKVRR